MPAAKFWLCNRHYFRLVLDVQFCDFFGIYPELIWGMERIPYLCEERISFGSLAIVPAPALALWAPVAAFQDKPGACLEFVAELAAECQLCGPVTFGHGVAEKFSAAEFRGLFHVFMAELGFGLCLVVAVVEQYILLAIVREIPVFPLRDSLVCYVFGYSYSQYYA